MTYSHNIFSQDQTVCGSGSRAESQPQMHFWHILQSWTGSSGKKQAPHANTMET